MSVRTVRGSAVRNRRRSGLLLVATICAGILSVSSAIASYAVEPGAQWQVTNWGSSTSFPIKITNTDGTTFTGQMGLLMDGSKLKLNPQDPASALQIATGENPQAFTGYNVEPSLAPPNLVTMTAYDPVTTLPTGATKDAWIKNQLRLGKVLSSTYPSRHWDEFRPNICTRLTGCLRAMSIGTQLMLWKLAGHNINPGKGMVILNQEKTAPSTDANYAGLQESHVMYFYNYLAEQLKGVGDYLPSQGASPVTFWRPQSAGAHGALTLGALGGARPAVAPSPQATAATTPPPATPTLSQTQTAAPTPPPPPPVQPIASAAPQPSARPQPVTPTLPHTGVDDGFLRGLAWWSAAALLLGIGLWGRSRELASGQARTSRRR